VNLEPPGGLNELPQAKVIMLQAYQKANLLEIISIYGALLAVLNLLVVL
jgi:hypothetical protein